MNKSNFELKGSSDQGLLGATIGFFFGVMAVSLFGPTSSTLGAALNLSPTQLGVLVAIPALTGSLLRIPLGASVDVNGGRKGFISLLSIAIVGLIGLCVLFTSYDVQTPGSMEGLFPVVLIFGCLAGCGIASFSVGTSQASYWFPRNRQGYASGVYGGLGNTSSGILAFCLPLLLSNFGFTKAYYVLAGIMTLGLILYLIFGVNAPYFQFLKAGKTKEEARDNALACGQELFPSGSVKESLKISAKIPQTWMLVLTYFTTFGGFMALTAWMPTFWKQGHHLDPMLAGGLTAIFSITSALVRIPAGKLSDKIGGVKVSMGALTLVAIAGVLMNLQIGWTGLFLISMIISVAFGFNNAATMKLVPEYVSNGVGGANGWVGGLGAFGGFVFPTLMGQLVGISPEYGFGWGFLIFTVCALICMCINYFGMIRKK